VNDFCNWLKIPFLGNQDTNLSLSALAVKFLVRFQYSREKKTVSQELLELIENTLVQLPFQKVILPTKEMVEIINFNKLDFDWMKTRLAQKNEIIKFNNNDFDENSFGNIFGVFSEEEKNNLVNLAHSNPEFDAYVKAETGLSIEELTSVPITNLSNLEFYIRKVTDSKIQGWSCYKNDPNKTVELIILLNNEQIIEIKANIIRADIIDSKGNSRSVGYNYDFGKTLSSDDLVTILIENKIVYSGSI
jgi:hypothetical protein